MLRNLQLYFEDILNSINKIERYVRDLSYQEIYESLYSYID